MQIGQRFRVIEPGAFGHEALDKLKHAVGTVDEAALHLPSIRVFAGDRVPRRETLRRARRLLAAASRGRSGNSWTRNARPPPRIRALRSASTRADAASGKWPSRILAGGVPLRLDKDGPARAEPPQRVVQSAGDADQFGRHCGIQIGPTKPRRALKRAILVENDALVDQRGPGQEIRQMRSWIGDTR